MVPSVSAMDGRGTSRSRVREVVGRLRLVATPALGHARLRVIEEGFIGASTTGPSLVL